MHARRGVSMEAPAHAHRQLIDARLGYGPAGDELPRPIQLHSNIRQFRFRSGQIGLLDAAVEPDQRLALLDPLPCFEQDLVDPAAGVGDHVDRLDGPGRSDRLDHFRDLTQPGLGDLHLYRRWGGLGFRPRPLLLSSRGRCAATGSSRRPRSPTLMGHLRA